MDEFFQDCLDNQKLVLFSRGIKLIDKEIGVAINDLAVAKDSCERHGFKWATIQAYYAMFHAAKALVYSRNFREKSHHCLEVALRVLFVEEGLMNRQVWRSFRDAKHLRETADYDEVFSESDTKTIINSAESFINEATSILGKATQ